jgi:hypothetical protein
MRCEFTIDEEDPEEVRAELAYHLNGTAMRNRQILASDPRIPRLYKSGVRYGLDADIDRVQRFLNVRQVLAQRFACCKSLCAWRVAELRNDARDENEAARVDFDITWEDSRTDPLRVGLVPKNGFVRLWHVNVRRADGSIENPSRRLRAQQQRPGIAGTAARRWPLLGKLRALR